jgi:hypothetical protein
VERAQTIPEHVSGAPPPELETEAEEHMRCTSPRPPQRRRGHLQRGGGVAEERSPLVADLPSS